jgi:flagellar protein FlgJ
MTQREFVKAFHTYAKQVEEETGFSAIAVLAQAALESGWGKHIVGNMIFGIKSKKPGEGQLITTTEYSQKSDLKFPVIISITPVEKSGKTYYKYIIKDWFRKYDTPKESFVDHTNFFLENKRYAEAVKVRGDYNLFFEEISRAGYATDPSYADTLKAVAKTVIKALEY